MKRKVQRNVLRRYECHRNGTVAKPARSRNKKKPNYALLFSLLTFSALVSCFVSFVTQTPYLNVKEIRIKGVHISDKEAVENAAKTYLGKNILFINKKAAVEKILSLNEVRDVKIGRKFPATVWIQVFERKADAVLTDGSNYCLIQKNGLMFHRVSGPQRSLPLIKVADCDKLKPGCVATSPGVRYALEVLNASRKQKLKLCKISVDPNSDICLNMGNGFYVKMGQPDEVEHKLSLIRKALDFKPSFAQDAVYMDVSCPAAPVWKPKAEPVAAS